MHLDPITLTAVLLITAVSVCGQQMVDDIEIHTSPLYIDGSTYKITCEFNEDTYTFRHWDHPDPEVTDITVTRGRFEILRPRSGVLRLIISDTSESDAGEYRCIFERTSNQQLVFASRVVEYREAIVFHTEDSLTYRHQAGEGTTLRCEADNVVSLDWLLDADGDIMTFDTTSGGRIQQNGNNLVFQQLLLSDSGTYCCVAGNDLGQRSIQAHLSVFREPSVVVNPIEHLVNQSDSATFVCRVEGSPLPTVQWAFADSSLEFRFIDGKISKREVPVNDYTIELHVTFHSVTDEDTAMYRCSAQNNNGSTSELASLQIYTEGLPSAPRQVTVMPLNHTAITVSWFPPEMEASQQITTYTVIVQATNGSISDPHMATVDWDTTHVVVAGLARLTNHTIFVYAINHIGRGRDSNIVAITTDPSVPVAVVEATFADVSPTSVLALWVLPEKDPGAPITEVLIRYRNVDVGETWEQARNITVNDISNESRNITGLIPRTQYQLQVTPGNWIGLGEQVVTPTFRTQPPGFPGSVRQLSAKNISTNQLALCWVPSSTGAHTEYRITAISLNITVEDRTWIFITGRSRIMQFSNGTEAAVLDGLDNEACYNFTVTLHNEQGPGLVIPSSGPICTSRDQPCVFDGCPLVTESPIVTEPSRLDSKIIAVVIMCSILGIVLLMLVLVLFVWKITRQGNGKDTYALSEKSLSTFSRVSSRSDRGLVDSDPELQAVSLNRQSSIGNTSSLSAGVSYSDQDTPNTGSTLLPDQNPFHFTPSASVNTTLEYPQPPFGHTPNGSLNHTPFPICGQNRVHWVGLGGVRTTYPQPGMMPPADLEAVQMVDNPLNPQFEEEKQAQLWGTPAQQSGYSVADTTDLDSLSTGSSPPPLPAFFGESYSQPSPRLQHRQPSPELAGSETEEDLEFTENQAYEDVSPKGERRRFQITSQERGAVFETVQFRKA